MKKRQFVYIGDDVKMGENVNYQEFVFIPNGVLIGNNVFIGPHVCFANDKHPPSKGKHWMSTVVEDNVVIGANTTILPGVTLKEGCVIGAGAVVTKDVERCTTVVGNPAKLLTKEPSV
jgi:acetyltransferase-like isoleucine patch superfamily enzyme